MMRRRSGQGSRVLRLRARRVLRPYSGRLLSAFQRLRLEVGKQAEVFDAEQLKRMLWSGQPDDAHYYLRRFLPFSGADWSELCTKLFIHVGVFKTLSKVVAGGEEGDRIASSNKYFLESPRRNGLDMMIAAMHADRTRGSMLWEKKIKPEGVDRIMDLVARCPELQGEARVQLPCERPMLWDATAAPNRLPECPRHCKQTANHAPADLLVRAFLRKRLLSIQGKKLSARSRNSSATPYMKMVQIAPQPAVLEGVSHAPVMCHIPHVMTSPSKNSGIFSSSANAAVTGDQGANSTVLGKQGIKPLDSI
ncbi:unnamed protein product [Urochloa decumbens]|uniref:Uncharacterized protein n=1 Tax=Urochloa decumbens TaxID=240449 RepID=A0ABC8ZAI8_9POAL